MAQFEQFNEPKKPRAESFYDATTPSLQVTARPLDMPVDTSALINFNNKQNEDLSFWNSLLNFGSSVMNVAQKIELENKELEKRKGLIAAATGMNPDDKATDEYLQSYYSYLADTDAPVYYTAMQQYVAQNQNKWQTPQEMERDLEEFQKEWIAARPSNKYYLESIAPHMAQVNATVIQTWAEQLRERTLNDIYNTALAGINQHADAVVGLSLQTIGVKSPDELILKYDNGELDLTGIHEAIRQGLSQAQDKASKLGLTKSEVSKLYVDRIGKLAVDLGMPELLDFADIKDEAHGGIKLNQTELAVDIEKYKANALKVKNSRLEARNQYITELKNQQEDLFFKDAYVKVSEYLALMDTNPQAAREEFQKVWDEWSKDGRFLNLKDTRFKELVDAAVNIIHNPHTFATIDNEATVKNLQQSWALGSLTVEEVTTALNNGNISLNTYKDYMSKLKIELDEERKVLAETDLRLDTLAFLSNPTQEAGTKLLSNQYATMDLVKTVSNTIKSAQETKTKTTQEDNFTSLWAEVKAGIFKDYDEIDKLQKSGDINATQAKQLMDEIEKKKKAIADEQKQFENEGIVREYAYKLAVAKTSGASKAELDQLKEEGAPASVIEKYGNILASQSKEKEEQGLKRTQTTTFLDSLDKVTSGELTDKEKIKELASKGYLTKDDAETLMNKIDSLKKEREKALKEYEKEETLKPYAQELSDARVYKNATEERYEELKQEAPREVWEEYGKLLVQQKEEAEAKETKTTEELDLDTKNKNFQSIITEMQTKKKIYTPDEIDNLALTGKITYDQAGQLKTKLSSIINKWKNDTGKYLDDLDDAAITQIAGSPYSSTYYKPTFAAKMKDFLVTKRVEFWNRHQAWEEGLVEAYRVEVYEPALAYGQDLIKNQGSDLTGQTSQTTKTGKIIEDIDNTTDKGGVVEGFKKFFSNLFKTVPTTETSATANVTTQPQETNASYLGISGVIDMKDETLINETTMTVDETVSAASTITGVPETELKEAALRGAADGIYNILKPLKGSEDFDFTADLQITTLKLQGFTDEQIDVIMDDVYNRLGIHK